MLEGVARCVPSQTRDVLLIMAACEESESLNYQRIPCLTLPGFRSLSVFSIVVTIVHVYELHALFFLCCTGGFVGAVQLVTFTWKLVWKGKTCEKLSVLCSSDSEHDPGDDNRSSLANHDMDHFLQYGFRFDADTKPTRLPLLQFLEIYIALLKCHGAINATTKYPVQREENIVLEKLKNLDASKNSKRICKLSKASEQNFDAARKQPEEHGDVSCIALQENVRIKWAGTSAEMSSADSSCAKSESGGQQTSDDKPSDGSGKHNPQGEQSCRENNKQSSCGKPTNQGNHGKQKHSSCGTSSCRDDDDEDRDDKRNRKPVEIPSGCQTNSSVDVVMEEKPADTSNDDASQENYSPSSEQNTDVCQDGGITRGTSQTASAYQEAVSREAMAEGSPDVDKIIKRQGFIPTDQNNTNIEAGDLQLEHWNQMLIATFQHQRNVGFTCSQCTASECYEIHKLISHCADCPLNVLGGCLDCMKYCHLLLYHVTQCHVARCTHRCHFIKCHIQVHGVPVVEQWSLALDKLFFRPISPDYPTSCTTAQTAVQPWPLESMAREEASRFSRPTTRDNNDNEWRRILVRGPLTPAKSKLEEEREPVLNKASAPRLPDNCESLSTGHGSNDPCYKTQQRPKDQVVLWRLNKEKISVTEDGHYDENFEWLQQSYVGGGQNGRCYQCIDNKTGFLFAIKKIHMSKFEGQELEVWGSLSGKHPNIVELFGAVKINECVIIFMEFMEGGSVCEHLRDHAVSEGQALHILQPTMSAIEFMHSQMIIHRDIKGGNVLLDADGKVKVADFGTAMKLTNKEFQRDNWPCGTEAFMPPEVCRSEDHSFSADVWSLMCLLYQLLMGHPPWQQHVHGSLLYKIGIAKEPPPLPPQCSVALVDFFQRGFIIEASERATVRELLLHDVFQPGAGVPYISLALEDSCARDQVPSSVSSPSGFDGVVQSNSPNVQSLSDSVALVLSLADPEVESDEEHIFDASSLLSDHNSDCACACVEQLPPDEQLSSLQSDLLLSLTLQDDDISSLFSVASDPTATVEDFDPSEFLAQLMSREQDVNVSQSTSSLPRDSSAAPALHGAYSMRDLTKIHILNPSGDYMFMVRHIPSVTYGTLAAQLHWSVADQTGLDFFTLTPVEGPQLCVWAAIGSEEQHLKVEPAYDVDSWMGWRVDQHGLVEQRPCD